MMVYKLLSSFARFCYTIANRAEALPLRVLNSNWGSAEVLLGSYVPYEHAQKQIVSVQISLDV